jgi:curved DNA-binding protein CbpA
VRVRHCTPHGDGYAIGLAFHEETKATAGFSDAAEVDYYSFLQVNPKADWSIIHRIYRMMAGRSHPDNPETGDPEKFPILQAAYETLSDPQRRAAYDASLQSREPGMLPIFELSEFVNGIEGEMNRRLGILSLLYNKRRTSPHSPGISLFDMEKRMGMPRECLEFSTWYLKNKQYLTYGDDS